jgi:hypothetical protein
MSISPIASNNSAIYSTQLLDLASVNSSAQNSDGDNNGNSISGVAGSGGKFASAISQALTQLGVTSPAASSNSNATDTSTAQDPQQALASFMQSLFAALHAQSGTQTATSNNSTSDNSSTVGAVTSTTAATSSNAVAGKSGEGHHHHHGGGGMSKLEGGLQNLIQQLSSSGQSASDSSTSTSDSNSSNSTLDALQQSFNNLLSADGASGNNVSLTSFLQSLSQGLQGAPATGNVVTTKV